MTADVVDLYAGPGGWDEGMRTIGITDVLGLEYEPNACATAVAAGHRRDQVDIAVTPTAGYVGARGVIASPPCQAWSMAGNRQGEQDRARVHALIDSYATGSDTIGDEWTDPRSHHAAQPVRWIRDLRPEWVCLEQVPAVLGLWEHAARVMRGWGYRTWSGVLNAADYGVPQTRQRAILIASRVRSVGPPPATHAQAPGPADLFGVELLPWVSMADALGWSDDLEVVSNYNTGGQNGVRGRPSATDPSATLTSKAGRMKVALRNGTQANASTRPVDQPAGTLFFGERLNNVSWVLRARAQDNSTIRSLDEPAPTITAGHDTANRVWTTARPATTVAGDPRISALGRRDREGGERQHEQSIRVSVQEAAILQSFPADYPWQGTKTAQYLQVGNAIPPLLAAHIVAAATGVDGPAS